MLDFYRVVINMYKIASVFSFMLQLLYVNCIHIYYYVFYKYKEWHLKSAISLMNNFVSLPVFLFHAANMSKYTDIDTLFHLQSWRVNINLGELMN